jgi:hypothetical protein
MSMHVTYNHAVKRITFSSSRTHEMNITDDPARLKQINSVACSFLIKLRLIGTRSEVTFSLRAPVAPVAPPTSRR